MLTKLGCGGSSGGGGSSCGSLLLVLLEGSHEGVLVGWGLETTVTELGAGINELQLDVFQGQTLGVN